MFATCAYCSGALGANEAIERFPVGRKLAFDGANGRLWVVCPSCSRWNLSPLEERWEAIEACERLYRGTPVRASTDQIGLAKVREGTQLVRIGKPSRPEFAAWRYAREFARRRLVTWTVMGGGSALMVGAAALKWMNPALAAGIPLIGVLPNAYQLWYQYQLWLKPVANVSHGDTSVVVRRRDIGNIRVEADDTSAESWRLSVMHGQGRTLLTGAEAERVLGRVMTTVNQEGGSSAKVDAAVRLLASTGSAEAFVQQHITRRNGALSGPRGSITREELLALEMALHERTERVALDGELASLEASWREAEAIAAIADNLLTPASVAERWRRLRGTAD
jgi:hypothetical protein